MAYDEWGTPKPIVHRIRNCLGNIDLDAASNKTCQEYIQADKYYGLDNGLNALDHDWNGLVFCNPPYSAGNIDKFTNKFLEGIIFGHVHRGIYLVNSATDTKWYQTLTRHTTCLLLWRGRIKFWKIMDGKAYEKWEGQLSKEKGLGKIGNSPRYLNTVFYYDRTGNIEPFLNSFNGCGEFMIRLNNYELG